MRRRWWRADDRVSPRPARLDRGAARLHARRAADARCRRDARRPRGARPRYLARRGVDRLPRRRGGRGGVIERVGFIGLGNMGGPMCGHLVGAGFDVTAYDLDDAALERARTAGARAAASAAESADGAQALITMLPAPPQVEQVLLGDGGVIEALARGSLAIDMSTSSIGVGRRVLEAADARGVGLLDAPVAGQSIGAQAGTLAIYVGGPGDAFARARPLFEAMGNPQRIFHLGPNG